MAIKIQRYMVIRIALQVRQSLGSAWIIQYGIVEFPLVCFPGLISILLPRRRFIGNCMSRFGLPFWRAACS